MATTVNCRHDNNLNGTGRVTGMERVFANKVRHGLVIALAVGSLMGCGGGGDAGGKDPQQENLRSTQSFSPTPPAVTFEVDKLVVTAVEGSSGSSDGFLRFNFPAQRSAMFWLQEPESYIVDGQVNQVDDNRFNFHFVLSDKLPPGEYDTEVTAQSCETDSSFEKCLTGAPVSTAKVPLHYVVKPNIHVQDTISLQRSGREPAPSHTVPVDIPHEAGAVTASFATERPDALQAQLLNGQLTISTTQARAGEYTGTVVLQGSANPGYRRTVQVSYKVLPPPGGEHDLWVDKPSSSADLTQGQTTSVRVKVSRPTWTSQWQAPQLINDNGLFSFRDLGNDEYELSVNTANAAPTSYQGALRFNDGTPAGDVDAGLYVNVNIAFGLSQGFLFGYELTPASSDASLVRSSPVVTFDDRPARWTAVSHAPWIKLGRTTGTTGIDPLTVQIDKGAAAAALNGLSDRITVTIDRPGTLALEQRVTVSNQLPRVARIVGGSLSGSAGRIYIDGYFPDFSTIPQNQVTVSGAQATSMTLIQDPRMLMPTTLLVLDVKDATPGQPISISLATPLLTTRVQQTVIALAPAPEGHVTLPYQRYRPAHYGADLRSIYIAAENEILRWTHDGASWALTKASVPGLIDVAPATEGDSLYGLVGRHLVKFNPLTLAEASRGLLDMRSQGTGWQEFDASAPANMSALSFSADGRAFASLVSEGSFPVGNRGVAAIRGQNADVVGQRRELASQPVVDEPGNRLRSFPASPNTGSGIVTSARGRSVMAFDPDGILWRYAADQRQWLSHGQLPTNTTLAAVDDDATLLITSDGAVLGGNPATVRTRLTKALPDFYLAGGYAITSDGNVALVYGYRIDMENGHQRARDAGLWVVDLSRLKGSTTEETAPAVLGRIPLQDAVGCTVVTVQGESCAHQATLVVSPNSLNAFLLGPRGLASVQIPQALLTSGASAPSARSASARAQGASIGPVGGSPKTETRLRGRAAGKAVGR